jgi:8-oxo-dGTP pyrophosphatase MutT (NUDIX family)
MAGPVLAEPRGAQVTGIDDHLPPVPADRLQPQWLRRRFGSGALPVPEFPGDTHAVETERSVQAAVLVPLVARDAGLQVLLTRRTAHLRDHAGQISFPGGRTEPADAGPVGTALRESAEEIGLAPDRVEVLGCLAPYITVTHYVVTPVVALVPPDLALHLDPFEVAEAFEVPLQFLMTPAHHRRHVYDYNGRPRHFVSMPWQRAGDDGQQREYFIWGATAAMLRNLYGVLSAPYDQRR